MIRHADNVWEWCTPWGNVFVESASRPTRAQVEAALVLAATDTARREVRERSACALVVGLRAGAWMRALDAALDAA